MVAGSPHEKLPTIKDDHCSAGVVFVVYAPFGGDANLSTYKDGASTTVDRHPLLTNLKSVAAQGTHVCALIDRVDDQSWLIEIPAFGTPTIVSKWKLDMNSHFTLAGLIVRARTRFTGAAMILSLEGHGAGFIPDIDVAQLARDRAAFAGQVTWVTNAGGAQPFVPGTGNPASPMGSPLLPMGSPLLPMGSPLLSTQGYPMSTWRLRQAFEEARKQLSESEGNIAVVHFNNCFNMAVEVLHTVAPYAKYAVGYMNYNFFTAGKSYPAIFSALRSATTMSSEQLARLFASGNRDALDTRKKDHPTVGAVIRLSRMNEVANAISQLAQSLTHALRTSTAATRPDVVEQIRDALQRAQNFDTDSSFVLETPDALTDIMSFAFELRTFPFNSADVSAAAAALLAATSGVKEYGDVGVPWVAQAEGVKLGHPIEWNFSRKELAMNILFPDPLKNGIWDWRSPYYLQSTSPVQPHVIDFLFNSRWVELIIEYHKDTPFQSLRAPALLKYPIYLGNPVADDRKL
jgi:Clostripain family